MKVLLVDDESKVRVVIRYLGQWEQLGITEILEASNGEEAQDIIEREHPEIIFTDIKMPKLNGIQLIEWLNETAYTGKVIMLTGYDDYFYMRKAMQCGSYDYLLKPIESEALHAVLEGAIRDWKNEEDDRRDKESGFIDEVRRLRIQRMVTAACEGEPCDWEEIARSLPKADIFDFTLIHFYHAHQSNSYIKRLADELIAREWGNAFMLQTDGNPCLIISKSGKLFSIEEWMNLHFDIPVRLVSGDPIKSLKDISLSYQSALKAVAAQKFRAIHRLSELEDAQRMQLILAFVEEHYMEELSLDKLANRFFLSREHISRRFKQEHGKNLSSYVIQLRIEQAKHWLSQTNETMYSISLKLGYQDEIHFSKLFKKIVGMTPLEYRSSTRLLGGLQQ